jgi:glycosyltransferase involved in cell wall biosynthesis
MYWNRLFNALTHWYFGACDRLLFKTAEVVVANSDDMARLARRLGAGKVQLIGTPLATDYLREPPAMPRDDPFEVVFAGRLAVEKNVLSLVDAAAVCPQIRFRIAGHGPLTRVITQRAGELPNLEYLGWLSRGQLCRVLDRANLLVLPSHVEAFGTAALEGMARARNVLVSGNCGILEWPSLKRGLFRLLPDEDIVSALQRIAGLDPALRQVKARIARRAALDLHAQTLRTWLNLLHGNGDH